MYIERLKKIKSLPLLPEVVLHLQELLSNDEGNDNSLAELIEQDPVLTSAVLKVANAAVFNFSGKRIVNLRDAVVRIGRKELMKVLISVSVVSIFPETDLIEPRDLWLRSFVSSPLIAEMGKLSSFSFPDVESLKSAALLHDIGHLIIACFFPEVLYDIRKEMTLSGVDYLSAEILLNKTHLHAELGSSLLELWRFSPDIFIPVRFHEKPNNAPGNYRPFVRLLNCCDAVLNLVNSTSFSVRYSDKQVETLLMMNGIDTDNLPNLLDLVRHESDHALTLLSLWGLGDTMGKLRSTGDTSLLRPV